MFLKGPRKILLLSGAPHVGKTTLIEFLYNQLKDLKLPYHLTGFITKELREEGERIGFDLIYLRDQTLVIPLARRQKFVTSLDKKYQVGRYIVFPKNLEKMLEIIEGDLSQATLEPFLIVDEIGKMELLSEKFISFIEHLRREGHFFIATLGRGEHPLLKSWSNLEEALHIEVTPENREFLRNRLMIEFHRRGKLFVLEGIDGVGKTTLFQYLREDPDFSSVIFSQEPTLGPYGRKLRKLLTEGKKVSQKELLELFLQDRREHVEKLILPALSQGKTIFLDRYYLSTVAYQGVEIEDLPYLLKRNETYAPLPDLVLYLDLPVPLALKRISGRDLKRSLFEREELLQRIAQNYERILPLFQHLKLSGNRSPEELYREIKGLLVKEISPPPFYSQ